MEIEKASLKEIAFFLDMAKAEGWNPGLYDALPFYKADPNGFLIGKLDGKKIGCISAVAYNKDYGFLGFYIIAPEYRGLGYGLKLWNHGIGYLGNRAVGLDGVVSQQKNYKKSGFKFYYNNVRFGGKIEGQNIEALYPLDKIPFPLLSEYDTSVIGFDRSRFLKAWIEMSNCFGFAKLEDSKLKGYGVIRPCATGFKIGPLFADDTAIAKEIFLALSSKSSDSEIFFDTPEINHEAVKLAKEQNLKPVFETARMYKNIPPKQLLKKVFGVTTFELG